MTKYRGHSIELVEGEWIYLDTKELVKNFHTIRTCGNCNAPYTSEGHDMCLGNLRGVMNACCGHGSEEEAYIQFLDGFCIRGKDAKIILNILKKSNQNKIENEIKVPLLSTPIIDMTTTHKPKLVEWEKGIET